MQASQTGRRLLSERQDVLAMLCDRDRLRQLPDGTLGREYCRFAETRALYPEDLAAAVREARSESGGLVPEATAEVAYLHDRYRDLHDLWHVAIGYGTDMAGEWGILAFQTRQVGYRTMKFLAFFGCMRVALAGRLDLIRVWLDGRRRARQAAFLMAQDWEQLLLMPLETVRAQLGLGSPPLYKPFDYPTPQLAAATADETAGLTP